MNASNKSTPEPPNHAWQDAHARFVGSLLAHTSHEWMNTLAVLRETTGLLQDMLRLKPDAAVTHRERFQRALATIQKNVLRGMQLGEHLNAFAHRMDRPIADFDLHHLLDHIAFFLRRPAEMKHLHLTRPPHTDPIPMRANPFLLQLVVTACTEHLFQAAPQDTSVSLQATATDAHITISIESEPSAQTTPPPDLPGLLHLMDLPASLQTTTTGLSLHLKRFK